MNDLLKLLKLRIHICEMLHAHTAKTELHVNRQECFHMSRCCTYDFSGVAWVLVSCAVAKLATLFLNVTDH